MDLQTYIHDKKIIVSSSLTEFLKQDQIRKYSVINRWGNDAVNRILAYTLSGKFLRAALLFLSAESFSTTNNTERSAKAASALELFQTGLLIHDDLMDQDERRRGLDSMHVQYRKILTQSGINHTEKTGESFALQAGDMSFFLAFQLLSSMQPSALSQKLTTLIASELGSVCVAQMQDVFAPHSKTQLTLKEILSVYTYKTGRYSVGLPLTAGGIIAGVDEQTIKKLWKFGTAL